MSEATAIQWTEATWNPWHGCLKVSPGCKNCYMYSEKKAYGQDPMVVQRSKTKFTDPLKWVRSGKPPAMCFTCSWSDWFIEQADEWRPEAWEIIRATPQITYQILTKRPERIAGHLPPDWGTGYPNVWLGVSAENDMYAEERIPILLETPAAIRFLSYEPALGPIELALPGYLTDDWTGDLLNGPCQHWPGLDWVIVGGESGPGAREFHISWARVVVLQCKAAKVACFVKQLGAKPVGLKLKDRKGGDMSEWPTDLRVREFPARSVDAANG